MDKWIKVSNREKEISRLEVTSPHHPWGNLNSLFQRIGCLKQILFPLIPFGHFLNAVLTCTEGMLAALVPGSAARAETRASGSFVRWPQ